MKLTVAQRKRFEDALSRQIEELVEHFSKRNQGGWPLDYRTIEREIVMETFNESPRQLIEAAFKNAGFDLVTERTTFAPWGSLVVVRRKKGKARGSK